MPERPLTLPASPEPRTARSLAIIEGHNFEAFAREFSNLPYGVDKISRFGYDVVHSDWLWRPSMAAKLLRRASDIASQVSDRPLTATFSQLRSASTADLCLSIFEPNAVVYTRFLQLAANRLAPHIVVSCWLAQQLLTLRGRSLGALHLMAAHASAITVFSRSQVDLVASALSFDREKIFVVPYGIDTVFYQPALHHDDYVAVAGNDAGRDWPTFFKAACLTPRVRYKVATSAKLDLLQLPDNIEVLGPLDHRTYRRLLQEARFVVVPVHPLAYPSGQSVLLESYACGKYVVTGDTNALSDYVLPGISTTYRTGDPVGLAQAITRAMVDTVDESDVSARARTVALNRFRTDDMWRAVALACDSVLAER